MTTYAARDINAKRVVGVVAAAADGVDAVERAAAGDVDVVGSHSARARRCPNSDVILLPGLGSTASRYPHRSMTHRPRSDDVSAAACPVVLLLQVGDQRLAHPPPHWRHSGAVDSADEYDHGDVIACCGVNVQVCDLPVPFGERVADTVPAAEPDIRSVP